VRIEIDGVPLPVRPGLVYLLLHKPAGVVSTASDPQGRPTVVDLAGRGDRVYPVGRLDADSEGLMLLTNDGDLAHRVTHPSFGVTKTYAVLVAGAVERASLRRLVAGVELDDGPAAARSARVIDRRPDRSLLEIVMSEGRKRQVRRMCAAIGHPVVHLTRTAIGPLRDPHLKPGDVRPLTVSEVRALYAAAGEPYDAASADPETVDQ
jgi:23S rRNA pseudouridine2605 synthase